MCLDIVATFDKMALDSEDWSFLIGSDHAGNAEVQNRRQSQNGLIIKFNGAPVMCLSKASAVTFSSPRIGEAHADMSSAGVEIYAVGNATMDIVGLSHVVEEMGMIFPFPFTLEMDNVAARTFCLDTAHKTKLMIKHIDCRQEWVKTVRNRDVMTPVHVDTEKHDADSFNKILARGPYEMVRNRIMVEHNFHHD